MRGSMTSVRIGWIRFVGGLLLLCAPVRLIAADIWVVRLHTPRTTFPGPGGEVVVGWRDHLVFRNTTSADLVVRGLAVSNGHQIPAGGDPLVIPAGRTVSVFALKFGTDNGVTTRWTPEGILEFSVILLVNRLDVPAGVIVESRGEVYGCGERRPCVGGPGAVYPADVLGHFDLPVATRMRAPNEPHYHLATDLGNQAHRTNVGVYNDESIPASAIIELRATCDDRVLESRTVSVPGKTLVYQVGFRSVYVDAGDFPCGFEDLLGVEYGRYVVVRMDRAGFSFTATRAEAYQPRITVGSTGP
jgi:hypothetical protein